MSEELLRSGVFRRGAGVEEKAELCCQAAARYERTQLRRRSPGF